MGAGDVVDDGNDLGPEGEEGGALEGVDVGEGGLEDGDGGGGGFLPDRRGFAFAVPEVLFSDGLFETGEDGEEGTVGVDVCVGDVLDDDGLEEGHRRL